MLRRYGIAYRELITDTIHSTEQYENSRAEQSQKATRVRERTMRKFKIATQTQRYLDAHAAVSNLFNLIRHLSGAKHYSNAVQLAVAKSNASSVQTN
jgi:putative transposase